MRARRADSARAGVLGLQRGAGVHAAGCAVSDPKHPGRYGAASRTPDSEPPHAPHVEKDTREIAIDVEHKVTSLLDARAKERIGGYVKAGLALLGVAGSLVSLGAVYQQSVQTRDDVARVLVVVERLDRAGVGVETRLSATERSLRDVETKMWEQRRGASGTRAPAAD